MRRAVKIEFNTPKATRSGTGAKVITTTTQAFQVIELPLPVLQSISIKIPKGHNDLAFLQMIVPHIGIIIPAPGGSVLPYHHGDDTNYDADDLNIRLEGPPYRVEMRGYNNDYAIDHKFFVTCIVSDQ